MWIVSKNRKAVVNSEQLAKIYTGADECCINCEFIDGKGTQLARYNTPEDAKIAFEYFFRAIKQGNTEAVFMPNDKELDALARREDKTMIRHAADGKKAVRRGGS